MFVELVAVPVDLAVLPAVGLVEAGDLLHVPVREDGVRVDEAHVAVVLEGLGHFRDRGRVQEVVMVELEQDVAGGFFAAERLQWADPLRSHLDDEGLDPWVVEVDRLGTVVVGDDPFPVGVGLGLEALVDLGQEGRVVGRCEYGNQEIFSNRRNEPARM